MTDTLTHLVRFMVSLDADGTEGESGPGLQRLAVTGSQDVACDMAKSLVRAGQCKDAYVHKLVCVAMFAGRTPEPETEEESQDAASAGN